MSKTYITGQGDTFDIIAFKTWGNEKLLPALLEANPGINNIFSFDAGVKIIIPEVETPYNNDPVPPWQR